MPDLRVAVVGPESSGKTALVEHLNAWLRARSVPVAVVEEQGRLLAGHLPSGHPWSYREQVATSLMHQGAEAAALVVLEADGEGGILLCDGTAATPAVWHLCAMRNREAYDAGPPEATRQLLQAAGQAYDLVLLLAPDLPWVDDGVRDDPEGREEAFDEYRLLYPGAEVISGPERLDRAVAVLERRLQDAPGA